MIIAPFILGMHLRWQHLMSWGATQTVQLSLLSNDQAFVWHNSVQLLSAMWWVFVAATQQSFAIQPSTKVCC